MLSNIRKIIDKQTMIDYWEERFSQPDFAYGIDANNYFKEKLNELFQIYKGNVKGKKILFIAEGEGRNAVYASNKKWQVIATDFSLEAKKKAMILAKTNNVEFEYIIGDFGNIDFNNEEFDVIVLIYAHFESHLKEKYYKKSFELLKKDGYIISELFSKSHLEYVTNNPKIGGPKNIDMLFSKNELLEYFPNIDILELVEKEVHLNEGNFHNGLGMVLRLFAQKKAE